MRKEIINFAPSNILMLEFYPKYGGIRGATGSSQLHWIGGRRTQGLRRGQHRMGSQRQKEHGHPRGRGVDGAGTGRHASPAGPSLLGVGAEQVVLGPRAPSSAREASRQGGPPPPSRATVTAQGRTLWHDSRISGPEHPTQPGQQPVSQGHEPVARRPASALLDPPRPPALLEWPLFSGLSSPPSRPSEHLEPQQAPDLLPHTLLSLSALCASPFLDSLNL